MWGSFDQTTLKPFNFSSFSLESEISEGLTDPDICYLTLIKVDQWSENLTDIPNICQYYIQIRLNSYLSSGLVKMITSNSRFSAFLMKTKIIDYRELFPYHSGSIGYSHFSLYFDLPGSFSMLFFGTFGRFRISQQYCFSSKKLFDRHLDIEKTYIHNASSFIGWLLNNKPLS